MRGGVCAKRGPGSRRGLEIVQRRLVEAVTPEKARSPVAITPEQAIQWPLLFHAVKTQGPDLTSFRPRQSVSPGQPAKPGFS